MPTPMLALAALASMPATLTPSPGPPFIDVKLVAQTIAPRPGQTVLVGLQMNPAPGWHGYWSNPGGSGLAPAVNWTAPPGVHFGPLQHPAPSLLHVQGITSYVHMGPHVLIAEMSVRRGLSVGTALPISAEVTLAACSDKLCVPEHATLSLQMSVGDGHASPDAALIRRAAMAEPKAGGEGTFDVVGANVVLQLTPGLRLDRSRARFFPDKNGFLDAAEEHPMPGSRLRISGAASGPVPSRISGVLTDGSASYRLTFNRGELTSAAEPPLPPPQPLMKASRPADASVPRRAASPTARTSNQPKRDHRDWRDAAIAAALLLAFAAVLIAGRRYARSRT